MCVLCTSDDNIWELTLCHPTENPKICRPCIALLTEIGKQMEKAEQAAAV